MPNTDERQRTQAAAPPDDAAPHEPLTPGLARIVTRLSGRDHLDSRAIGEALALPLEFSDVAPFVRFDAESYVRTVAYRDARMEVRVFSWRPGQSTSLHGHGDAACAFRIVRGAATESVLGERDRVWPPGSVVTEEGPRVHQVTNAGGDALLSVHVYSPPLPMNAQSSPEGRQVVIVGGGFGGAAVARALLREGGGVRAHIVEAGPWLGLGIAYGVESPVFRLNVPASRMSIDPDVPDDFVRFAGAEDEPHAFLSRALFGKYVTRSLAEAIRASDGKLRLWRDEATAVGDGEVVLRSGRRLAADAIVLATGLTPRRIRAGWHPGIVDAWDECGLATLPRRGRILIVGSGLSALDVLAFLDAQGYVGETTIASLRGLLPFPHEETPSSGPPTTPEDLATAPRELRALLRWVRARVEGSGASPWQHAMEALRPHVAELYRRLSPRDRARFARHLRPYWDVVRHRAPTDALARAQALERAGRLRKIAARVTHTTPEGDGVRAEIVERWGARRVEHFDAVVRCIGPALDAAEGATPLIASLLEGGHARLTSDGLGIETLPDGRVVDARGVASRRIVGVGSVCRASSWETTSVPDIAVQARRAARVVLDAIGS